MSIKESQNCDFCNERDYIEHFFVECRSVTQLCEESESQIIMFTGKRLKLTPSRILLGVTRDDAIDKRYIMQINHAILIGKMVISKFKYGNARNLINIFENDARIRNLWRNVKNA